jgi:N-carbamoylputrescine amidase
MEIYEYEPNKLLESYKDFKKRPDPIPPTPPFKTSLCDNTLIAAAIQLTAIGETPNDVHGFWIRAQNSVIQAAHDGVTLILLPKLFMGPYFCQSQETMLMGLAEELDDNFIVNRFQQLANKYNVVLPISLFERCNNVLYNTVVMIDADGSNLGFYRKSHIPDGTGYQEKFYFSPGDTGFKVFDTKVGKVGVGICWDQWFPEAARAMALQGADVLLYPTAIGSEPQDPSINSAQHWQRTMQGHAAANMIPVVASNRCGTEVLMNADGSEKQRISFYGRSFITDNIGEIIAEAKDGTDIILSNKIDVEANRATRAAWGLFRDRRPELYGILKTKDGSQQI